MYLFRETILLFSLNLLDAILTLIWVRSGVAPEGNHLMANLLDIGDYAFIAAKLAMGLFAAYVFLRWGNVRLARYGVSLVLVLYVGLMGIHLLTGLAAFGYLSSLSPQEIITPSFSVFGIFR